MDTYKLIRRQMLHYMLKPVVITEILIYGMDQDFPTVTSEINDPVKWNLLDRLRKSEFKVIGIFFYEPEYFGQGIHYRFSVKRFHDKIKRTCFEKLHGILFIAGYVYEECRFVT